MGDVYRWNLHVHTYRSECALPEMTIPDLCERGATLGYQAIALTDHVNLGRPWELEVLRADAEELAGYQPPLRVLLGTEATMLSPTQLCLPAAAAQGLDFVMVAANHYHLEFVEQPPSLDPDVVAAHCLAMTEGAIALGYCDVIAHPLLRGSVPLTVRELAQAYPDQGLAQLCRKAAAAGVALEINPRLPRAVPDFFSRLFAAARAAGARFTLGTDAHRLVSLDYDPEHHATLPELYALGLRPQDLLPPQELAGRRGRG